MACGMAIGKAWFKVPSAIQFELKGKLNPYISGKDVILHIIGMIGVDGALYKSMEFVGKPVHERSADHDQHGNRSWCKEWYLCSG